MSAFKAVTVRDCVLVLLIVAYTILFIAGHDLVSQTYGALIAGLDRKGVESGLFFGAMFPGLVGFVWLIFRQRGRPLLWVEGIVLGALLWGASIMLICTNVECIHYLQYAILGLLVRSLVDGDVLTLLCCNLVGMSDEFVQYVLNPHYTKYLDFNDMVLNMIGAMVGIGFWHWAQGGRPNEKLVFYWKRFLGFSYGIVGIVAVWGVATGRIVEYWPISETPYTSLQSQAGNTVFVLSYVDLSEFYLTTGLGRKYHVMDATEWMWVSIGLLAVAWGFSLCRPQDEGCGLSGGPCSR